MAWSGVKVRCTEEGTGPSPAWLVQGCGIHVCTQTHVNVCLRPFCIDSLGPETSFAAGLTQGAGSVCTLDPMVWFNPMFVTAY